MATRVQLVVKGQRFEADRALLERNSGFFRSFFAKSATAEGPPPRLEGGAIDGLAVEHSVTLPSEVQQMYIFRFPTLSPEFMGALLVYMRKAKMTFVFRELSAEQQQQLVELVRLLEIEALYEACGHVAPDAVPDPERNLEWGALPREGIVGKALELAERMRAEQQGSENVRAQPNPPHPSIDDDGLELPSSGCEFCGVSGHMGRDCTRVAAPQPPS